MESCDCCLSRHCHHVEPHQCNFAGNQYRKNRLTSFGWSCRFPNSDSDHCPKGCWCSTASCRCNCRCSSCCSILSYCRYSCDSSFHPDYVRSHHLELNFGSGISFSSHKGFWTVTSIAVSTSVRAVAIAHSSTLVATMTIHLLFADSFLNVQQLVLYRVTLLH